MRGKGKGKGSKMESPGYLQRADGINAYERVLTSALDLFSVPHLDVSTENNYVSEFSPTVAITNNTTDIQVVCGTTTDYTDLSRSNILIETHLETAAGGPLPGNLP